MKAYHTKPPSDAPELLVFPWGRCRSDCEASQQLPQSAMASDPNRRHNLISPLVRPRHEGFSDIASGKDDRRPGFQAARWQGADSLAPGWSQRVSIALCGGPHAFATSESPATGVCRQPAAPGQKRGLIHPELWWQVLKMSTHRLLDSPPAI